MNRSSTLWLGVAADSRRRSGISSWRGWRRWWILSWGWRRWNSSSSGLAAASRSRRSFLIGIVAVAAAVAAADSTAHSVSSMR